jgi:hypothetical protein
MNRSKVFRVALMSLATLVGLLVLLWGLLWVQLLVVFPPEHVYLSAESPDGTQIALFSIKYQGIHPWFPTDIEPRAYITVVETRHGSTVLRETECHGTVKNSFAELARQHAPWATDQVMSLKWATSP